VHASGVLWPFDYYLSFVSVPDAEAVVGGIDRRPSTTELLLLRLTHTPRRAQSEVVFPACPARSNAKYAMRLKERVEDEKWYSILKITLQMIASAQHLT